MDFMVFCCAVRVHKDGAIGGKLAAISFISRAMVRTVSTSVARGREGSEAGN